MSLLKAITLSLMLPSAVHAQAPDLRPISEYLQLSADRSDAAYPFLRCVGLFQGFFRYGGANVSDEDATRAQIGNEAMGLVALYLRQEKHPNFDINDLASQLGSEIENATQIYQDRMTRNYSLTGEAYGSDATIIDDFETCATIVQQSIDTVFNNQ